MNHIIWFNIIAKRVRIHTVLIVSDFEQEGIVLLIILKSRRKFFDENCSIQIESRLFLEVKFGQTIRNGLRIFYLRFKNY